MEITAKGIKNDIEIEVSYKDGDFLFNGNKILAYEEEMNYLISERYPIGGTFYPKKDDIRNVINVLTNYFYDKPAEYVHTSGKIKPIPQPGGPDAVY